MSGLESVGDDREVVVRYGMRSNKMVEGAGGEEGETTEVYRCHHIQRRDMRCSARSSPCCHDLTETCVRDVQQGEQRADVSRSRSSERT